MILHSCTLALGGRRWRGVLASLSRKGLTRIDEDRFYVLTQKGLEATQKIRQFYAESS